MLHLALGCEGQVWKPLEQHRQRDPPLHLPQLRSQAKMRAAAEGEMLDILALDVELARIGLRAEL